MVMVTYSPQHVQWILHVALSMNQSGAALNDALLLLTRIAIFCLQLWNPGRQGPLSQFLQ